MSFFYDDRKQAYLLPLSLEDWLPADHLARFIVEVVEASDLSKFHESYNPSGVGAPAYSPAMMVGVLLYAYSQGERSSRRIERMCREDVAVRYLAVNREVDHSSICRFRTRHEENLRTIFVEILKQCQAMGMVKVGVLSLDGTKIKANASLSGNRTEEWLEKEIEKMMSEAAAKDKEEDRKYGKRGKEEDLPKDIQDRDARMAKLQEYKERLAAKREAARAEQERKLAEREVEEAASGHKKRGRKPATPDEVEKKAKEAKVNTTDPDSGIMKTQAGFVQGYNAQAVVTAEQIIVAAEVTQEANDQQQLVPMLSVAEATIKGLGIAEGFGTALVDAGYPNEATLAAAEEHGWDVLGATQKSWKQRQAAREEPFPKGRIPKNATRMQRMTRRMLTKEGREQYKKRGQTVEPVFGQLKRNLRFDRFSRRGQSACQSEWLLICSAHNVLKFWRASRLASRN